LRPFHVGSTMRSERHAMTPAFMIEAGIPPDKIAGGRSPATGGLFRRRNLRNVLCHYPLLAPDTGIT